MKPKKSLDFTLLLKILLAFALGILSVKFVDAKIRPTVMTTLITHSRTLTLTNLNSAVQTTLDELPENFVTVSRNDFGQVTAIETNAFLVNLFQVNVSERLNSAVSNIGEEKIPIGSLSGLVLLNGKGFGIPFRISPLNSVSTEIKSEFTSAGVNQTRHRIVLKVNANVKAIIPTYEINSTVTADYIICETVIVGVTPDFFLQNSKNS